MQIYIKSHTSPGFGARTRIRFLLSAALLSSLCALSASPVLAQDAKAPKTPAPKVEGKASEKPAEKTAEAKGKTTEAVPPAVDFKAGDVWNVDIFKREDHKVLVIQDRVFTKAKKFELGVDLGVTSATAFYKVYSYGAHAGYNFSEYSGVEAFYTHSSSAASVDKDQLDTYLAKFGLSATKEYKRPTDFGGVAYVWSPIYGKFAFFRSSIIYFDVYGTAGISVLSLKTNLGADRYGKDQILPGTLLSVGARAYVNKHWSVRMDVRNNVYRTEYAPITDPITKAIKVPGTTLTRANWQFTAGLSYLFGFGG